MNVFPGKKTGFPENMNVFPGKKNGFPENMNVFPGKKNGFPENMNVFPGKKNGFPENMNVFPGRKNGFPENMNVFPGKKNGFPENMNVFPGKKNGFPENMNVFPGNKDVQNKRLAVLLDRHTGLMYTLPVSNDGNAVVGGVMCAVSRYQGVCMGKHGDWIPTQESQLVVLMNAWGLQLNSSSSRSDFGWPASDCTAAWEKITRFQNARTAYLQAPTGPNATEKAETKEAAIDAMRKFARENVRHNTKMSDKQKQEMGVTVADVEPTPVPVPGRGPGSEAQTDPLMPGVVSIRYLGAKPYGVDRVEIAYAISETPVESPDQLLLKETFSRNPWEHTFSNADRAKKLYYALRYLTKTGASHWSDVKELVVP